MKVLNKNLLFVIISLLSFTNEAWAHAGHSHSSGSSSIQSDLSSSTAPFAVGLSARGGYEKSSYSAVLPGVALSWREENFNLSPGYEFRLRQFLETEELSSGQSHRPQDMDHHAWLNFQRKLSSSYSLQAKNEFELISSNSEVRGLDDQYRITLNPAIAYDPDDSPWMISAGYFFEHRRYPNGTLSIPPLSGQLPTITPRSLSATAPTAQIVKGVSDREQAAQVYVSRQFDNDMKLYNELRASINQSQDQDREYRAVRTEPGISSNLWKGATAQLQHQVELRFLNERKDWLHKSEALVSQKLTKWLSLNVMSNYNLHFSEENSRWMEAYVELRTVF